jgi:S1-C subfamily serine protease
MMRLRRAEEESPSREDLLAETRAVLEEMQDARSEEERARLEKRLEELRDSVRGELEEVAKKAASAQSEEDRARLEKRLAELRESVRGEFRDVAKQMQEAKTAEERARLEKRLEELEESVLRATKVDWTQHVGSYEDSIFLCVAVWPDEGRVGIGTAFCVRSDGLLATNAHVAKMLGEAPRTSVLQNKSGKGFRIIRSARHPRWNGTAASPDVAVLEIDTDGASFRALPLAEEGVLRELAVGAPLGTLGFPGELASSYLRRVGEERSTTVLATFKVGMVSAITDFGRATAPFEGSRFIQHSASLSGGTSGSPMFDAEGRVVALNNSGLEVPLSGVRTPSASEIGFAIRVDLLRELLAGLGW